MKLSLLIDLAPQDVLLYPPLPVFQDLQYLSTRMVRVDLCKSQRNQDAVGEELE
jgi:hypothetical protein